MTISHHEHPEGTPDMPERCARIPSQVDTIALNCAIDDAVTLVNTADLEALLLSKMSSKQD